MPWDRIRRLAGVAGAATGCLSLFVIPVLTEAAPQIPGKKPAIAGKPKSAENKKSDMTSADYTQDVQSDGPVVTVLLNGWPIADLRSGGQQAGLINDSVIDGVNHLAVTIAPPPGNKKPTPPDTATVLIQRDDDTVLSLKWAAGQKSPPLPLHKEISFQSGTHFGPRAWQGAPQVTLDAAAEQSIRAQVHRFHDILSAKDLDGMVKMFAARDREDALSHGETPAQNEAAARKDYQEMLAEPHWHMQPVRDARLQFHLVADRRVVRVDYGPDSHVLMTTPAPNGDVSAFDLYLSFLNGQWTIVR